MALKLSQQEVMDLRGRAESALARAKRAMEKADVVVDRVVKTTVTGGTAFALGVAQGRYGSVEVVGVPADLGLGVLAHVAGFAGVGGNANDYLHAVGDGALAAYLVTLGRGVGKDWAEKSGASQPPAAASGHTVSDAELRRLASGAA